MPLFESSRKAQSFGSSLAMTLPALFAKVNGLEKGSEVRVFFGMNGVLVVSCVDDEEAVAERLMDLVSLLDKRENEKERK